MHSASEVIALDMAGKVVVEGGGVGALRGFLAANLRREQLERPEVTLLLSERDESAPLGAKELRLASRLLSELRTSDEKIPSVRSLLRGRARVAPVQDNAQVEVTEERKKYLEKRRKKLLRLDEELRYRGMVRNVKTQTASRELERHQTSVKQHLSIGANMIVARVTAFVAIYMAARTLTDSETTVGVTCSQVSRERQLH